MRRLLLFLFFIIYYLPSVAQSWEQEIPLVKTRIHQVRLLGTEEWEDLRKTDYAYDHYNRETHQIRWRKDEGQWILSSRLARTFDEHGHQNRLNRLYYNLENGDLRFEINTDTEYDNGNLTLRHTTLEDFEKGTFEEYLTEVSFDVNGNLIERIEVHTDETGHQSGWRLRQTFNAQGCLTAKANDWLLNDRWLTFDSSYYETDALCEILLWEYYFGSSLEFRRRYETNIDDAGRIKTKFTFSQLPEDSIWNYYSAEEYEYDEAGNNTSHKIRYYRDSTEILTLRTYDTEDRLTRQTRQYKDFQDETWMNDYEFILEYTSEGNRKREIFRNQWDENTSWYYAEYQIEFNYSEEDLVKVVYTTSYNRSVYSKEAINMNYRCDNALTERISEIIVNPNSWDQYENRYILEYYHTSPCQDLTSREADIRLFPNPASDYVHVISPKSYGRSVVSLITTAGHIKQRKEVELSNYFSLDISGLDRGIYVLKIQSPEGEFAKRLMIR